LRNGERMRTLRAIGTGELGLRAGRHWDDNSVDSK